MDLSDETTAPQENVTLSRRQRWLIQNQDFLTRIGPLVISIGFVIAAVVLWATGKFSADSVGYAGVWFFSFIGAASIFIPVPGLAAVCVAASPAIGLNPLLVGVIAGSAEALGEMTGYLAGLSGKALFERNRFYPRFRDLLSRYGGIILFFGSIVPNPLFDLLGIAAGSMLYPVRKFLLILFVSKSIKSTWIAFGCYWGVTWIENILN
jgi:membrane protein YqaA with SNARE-associated domain